MVLTGLVGGKPAKNRADTAAKGCAIPNLKGDRAMDKQKLGPQTLLFPMPAVLVGALVDGKPNFMTAAWCGIAASNPPAISVGLQKIRHTLKGVKAHGTFSINVPCTSLAAKVDYCGIYSGKKRDKSKIFEIFYGVLETAPLVQECPVNLECRLRIRYWFNCM